MGMLEADQLIGLVRSIEKNQQLIANNLANLNTPGYRTARMRFSRALDELMDENGELRPGARLRTEIYRPMFSANGEGNDVSLDRELVELTKNTLRMKLHLAALSGKIRRMRSAISGR
jgi:flagellar basal-body rod protein FlgB